MNSGWTLSHFGSILGSILGAIVAAKPAVLPLLPLLGPAAPIVGGAIAAAAAVYGVMQDPPR